MIETGRLRLRSWRGEDLAPFHAICSDPQVMATLGPVMSLAEKIVVSIVMVACFLVLALSDAPW